jgi:hypothetical protein
MTAEPTRGNRLIFTCRSILFKSYARRLPQRQWGR